MAASAFASFIQTLLRTKFDAVTLSLAPVVASLHPQNCSHLVSKTCHTVQHSGATLGCRLRIGASATPRPPRPPRLDAKSRRGLLVSLSQVPQAICNLSDDGIQPGASPPGKRLLHAIPEARNRPLKVETQPTAGDNSCSHLASRSASRKPQPLAQPLQCWQCVASLGFHQISLQALALTQPSGSERNRIESVAASISFDPIAFDGSGQRAVCQLFRPGGLGRDVGPSDAKWVRCPACLESFRIMWPWTSSSSHMRMQQPRGLRVPRFQQDSRS